MHNGLVGNDTMHKNIFLTGAKKTGKSTIITNAVSQLNLRPSGFQTIPMQIGQDNQEGYGIIKAGLPPLCNQQATPIGIKDNQNSIVPIPSAFDKEGVSIIKESLAEQPQLLLMDELGFLENNSPHFQEWVFRCLVSPYPVLGVIKPVQTPFLDRIRAFPGVLLIEIDLCNRKCIASHLISILRKIIQDY